MVHERIVVTVDGVGASGKSAISRALAGRLGYGHLNSGLLYRAVGYLVLKGRGNPQREEDVVRQLDQHPISIQRGAHSSTVIIIDGAPVKEFLLNSSEVSAAASIVAQHEKVRERFLEMQRTAFIPDGIVAEGRDMGTVVFPEAQVKFFITARLDVRAKRRFLQLQGDALGAPLDVIEAELASRDERDANRAIAPMRPAPGAVVIDNSDEPVEKIVARMADLVNGRA